MWSSYLPTLKPGCPAHLLSITPGSIEHLNHNHLFFFFLKILLFRVVLGSEQNQAKSSVYSVYTLTHIYIHTHTHTASPIIIPHQSSSFVTADEPTQTCHCLPESTLDVELSVGFDKGMVGSQVKNPPAIAGDAGDSGLIPVGKIPWSRKWQPTPVFLPGRSHGQRSLAGCSPWGHSKSWTRLKRLNSSNIVTCIHHHSVVAEYHTLYGVMSFHCPKSPLCSSYSFQSI